MVDIAKIEAKWQKSWDDNNSFEVSVDSSKPKYYVLEMFPYPSGKLHMGHLRNYAIGDVVARHMSSAGYNVLHPMGWDAFGLPAENAAIDNNSHPADWTYKNIDNMRSQLQAIGLSYDWKRELASCDPSYYKHEQKFFLELLEKGLAYRKESIVNWDPVDNTVLANEQVVDGKGWRSGAVVERKSLRQWSLRITNYAQELLDDIANLPEWPSSVRHMQENWIGRSEGAYVKFRLKDSDKDIEVFTTRPDTLFGASFIGVAYNHQIIKDLAEKSPELAECIKKCSQMSTSLADVEKAEKFGIDTGIRVVHPLDESIELPVYIANFVLSEYGTGAIFACPGHDERDHEFATKYNLPILQVVNNADTEIDIAKAPYIEEGKAINSQFLDGLETEAAKKKVIEKLEESGCGRGDISYRLKDWGISRQRFWGCPIPVIHCGDCGIVSVPADQLPVELPKDVSFDIPGNPLDRHSTWKKVSCPKCGGDAERETDTFDTFFESSWYFARFCSPNADEMVDRDECKYWMPVDRYIGGVEHAVLHLLYARFFTKAMRDLGYLNVDEPFTGLLTQGMVLHATFKDSDGKWVYPDEIIEKDGKMVHSTSGKLVTKGKVEKMSKSKKNVIDLESLMKNYGADTARMFVLSDSPPEKDLEWSSAGVDGCWRFIKKLFVTAEQIKELDVEIKDIESDSSKLSNIIHSTIFEVTRDIRSYHLNKAIAKIRELNNALADSIEAAKSDEKIAVMVKYGFEVMVRLLNPFTPHITEEIWQILGHSDLLCDVKWPEHDEAALKSATVTLAIQVNGKLRATHDFDANDSKENIEKAALKLPAIERHIEGKTIRKVIVVQGKIVNIVVG